MKSMFRKCKKCGKPLYEVSDVSRKGRNVYLKRHECDPRLKGLKKSITPDDVCEMMNDLLRIDYDSVHALVFARIRCNNQLAEHPTVQVSQPKRAKYARVGLLGILNGLFGIREDGMGAICADIDKGKITQFRKTPSKR